MLLAARLTGASISGFLTQLELHCAQPDQLLDQLHHTIRSRRVLRVPKELPASEIRDTMVACPVSIDCALTNPSHDIADKARSVDDIT